MVCNAEEERKLAADSRQAGSCRKLLRGEEGAYASDMFQPG